ncbi:electron transfer flavoprotein [Cutibacterium acnes JCM 18909]|nr:electron transfer flavoprotein [Cutibacterium acnes JCM 18909]
MTLGDDKTSEWSSVQVAGALAALIQRIGGVTLVVTGDASVDEGAQLMPALVGARIGLPTFLEVTHVEPSGTGWQITQNYGGGSRVVRTDGATVIATTPDATTPKAPGMKGILKAAKKPMEDVKCSELDLSRATVNVVSRGPAPVKERKHQVFSGDGAAAQLVAALRDASVI